MQTRVKVKMAHIIVGRVFSTHAGKLARILAIFEEVLISRCYLPSTHSSASAIYWATILRTNLRICQLWDKLCDTDFA